MIEHIGLWPAAATRGSSTFTTTSGLKCFRAELGPGDSVPIPAGCRTFIVIKGHVKIRFWSPPRDWRVMDYGPGSLITLVGKEEEPIELMIGEPGSSAHALIVGFIS